MSSSKVNARDAEKVQREVVAERILYHKLRGVPATCGRNGKV